MISEDHVDVPGTHAVLLAALDPSYGQRVTLENQGSVPVYIGDENVATDSGLELAASGELQIIQVTLGAGESLWGITDGDNTVSVQVLRNFLSES
jgi:hypothetical protein